MQFSSRFAIAVHVLLAIHEYDGVTTTSSKFLAGSVNVNPVIVRNTLLQLKAAGIVSVRNGKGGASIIKDLKDITMLDVFQAVEKERALFRYHDNPNPDCPVGRHVHEILNDTLCGIQDSMYAQMRSVTLQDLADDLRRKCGQEGKPETTQR